MAILPKAIYMFNAIPIKIPIIFITEIENYTLKFIWKQKRLQIAKAILGKKNNAGRITIPNSKLYYIAILLKTEWYWHKNRFEDQWNRIEDLHMNPHRYSHLIFDEGSNNKCRWEKWLSACRKLKLDTRLSPCTSINSNGFKDLHIRPGILKFVQERAGNTLEVIAIGKEFLSRTPAAQ
jgi:hypothetical protein